MTSSNINYYEADVCIYFNVVPETLGNEETFIAFIHLDNDNFYLTLEGDSKSHIYTEKDDYNSIIDLFIDLMEEYKKFKKFEIVILKNKNVDIPEKYMNLTEKNIIIDCAYNLSHNNVDKISEIPWEEIRLKLEEMFISLIKLNKIIN